MILKHLNILLADDDHDDCIFFKRALTELVIPFDLVAVHDGEQVMDYLTKDKTAFPDVLFLDLNMPRKNGFECLSEIKSNEKLVHLPVIVFSTSFEQSVVNTLYENGAQYFIRKPAAFSQFKNIIQKALMLIAQGNISQQNKENFVL